MITHSLVIGTNDELEVVKFTVMIMEDADYASNSVVSVCNQDH